MRYQSKNRGEHAWRINLNTIDEYLKVKITEIEKSLLTRDNLFVFVLKKIVFLGRFYKA